MPFDSPLCNVERGPRYEYPFVQALRPSLQVFTTSALGCAVHLRHILPVDIYVFITPSGQVYHVTPFLLLRSPANRLRDRMRRLERRYDALRPRQQSGGSKRIVVADRDILGA